MREKIVSLVLILILLGSICIPVCATSTSDLEEQKKDLQGKIDDAEEQQEGVHEELSAQMKEISNLDAAIATAQEEIDKLDAEISQLETSIDQKEKELKQKQEEYEKNKTLLEERLVVMYEIGETSFLDILFSSSNIIEFISNYYMITQITECDKELLDSIEKEQQEIEETKKQLEEEKTRIDSAKAEKVTKANLLKSQKAERQTKANALSAEEKALQATIDDYNTQVDKIESQIQEAFRKAQEQIDQSTGGAGLKFDGSFIWPCNNKIVTSTVKIRWGRWHKGIDIGAHYENVYAAASGYAYTMENPSGYGHYIMVVHGGGYITLYGHLNSYNISYGQYVSQGQVIAKSGNSGSSQGAHLHFEIRRASSLSGFFSSSFLNPLDYLPGGYSLAAGASTPS